MTLRANEIGADVYSTEETELDKNNLGVEKEETERRVAFPELSPGRAVLDVEDGALYEIMHRTNGVTDTVEGCQSEFEERMNYKYRTPEGQDWGGIIQHYYISYAKRDCPTPNAHGEIQAPINRPDESDITDINPPAFENNVLVDADGQPRPLLLLERPEVTYEEVIPGDTYDILGWYDPSEQNPDDRVKPVENIAHDHPDIAGVDYDTRTAQELHDVGIRVQWDDVSGTSTVQIAASDNKDADYEVSVQNRARDFHITLGSAFGETRFLIDSPFDAKEDIKSISAQPRWASEKNLWALKAGRETLVEMITEFTAGDWTFTIDASAFERYADTDVSVEPEYEASVSINEVFEYTFTEEVEVGVGLTIPGVDGDIDLDGVETDVVEITSTAGNLTIADSDTPGDNHIETLEDGQVGFACPKGNAGLVKSLDWKDARYEWNNDNAHWRLNADVAGDLIAAFLDEDKPVTAPVSILRELGEEDSITEERRVEVDDNAITGLDTYQRVGASQDDDTMTVDVSSENTATCEQIHGTAPSDPDRLSLMALDLSIADNAANAGMSVDLGGADLKELPATVTDEWQPSANTKDGVYEWYQPMTTARIRVVETEGWGTEYDVYVQEPEMDNAEHVVTLADERMVVLTVITHLKALTDFQ